MLIARAAPAQPVLPLDLVKLHCRIDSAYADALITKYIGAAAGHVERYTGRTFAPTDFELRIDGPCSGDLQIAVAPVRDVTRVRVRDGQGAAWVDAPEGWTWEQTEEGAILRGAGSAQAALIEFAAGYDREDASEGDAAFGLPGEMHQAALMLVAHWWRTPEAVGDPQSEVPLGVKTLLDDVKIYR